MLGTSIHGKRVAFIEAFRSVFSNIYNHLAASGDHVSLDYESALRETSMDELLFRSRQRDTEVQYTTAGIHKDDLAIDLEGRPAKKIASQGQQKSIVIALKLAHYEYLSDLNGAKPILLLDDIFDKLDDKRVGRLMELVTQHTFGQIFITDTHPERVPTIFDRIHVPVRVFQVESGLVNEPLTGIGK
jgi:DNA replication and repair protein RecF